MAAGPDPNPLAPPMLDAGLPAPDAYARPRWHYAGAVFLILFAAYSIYLKVELRSKQDESTLASVPLGQPPPEFVLSDTNGKSWDLAKVLKENKVVLISFWGSWCGPCRIEMPGFNSMYAKDRAKGLMVLAIDEEDKRSDLDAYLKAKPVGFPVLLDPNGDLAKRLGIEAFPTNIIVGPRGKVFHVAEGVEQYLRILIESQLNLKDGDRSSVSPAPGVTYEVEVSEPQKK